MKNEELFDLLTELKVDDRFIEEAITDDLESPVKAYAGNVKRSPMRIIAPIAACLAVFVGAGVVIANVKGANRPPITPAAASSSEESTAESSQKSSTTVSSEDEFIEKCKGIVKEESELVAHSDVDWNVENRDIDFDGNDELLLYPKMNGMTIEGVGVRVFKQTDSGDIQDLGGFAANSRLADLYYSYSDETDKKFYYYSNIEPRESCVETVNEVYFDEEANTLRETEYLRFATTYPENENSTTPLTEKAYRYGKEVDVKDFLNEWKELPNIPSLNAYYGYSDIKKAVEFLIDKYDVPVNDYNELHRAVGAPDINNDGRNDAVITFKDCEQLRGIYVFDCTGGEPTLIGELDLAGDRLEMNHEFEQPRYDLIGELINPFGDIGMFCECDDGSESFRFYRTYHRESRGDDPEAVEVDKYELHKIIVNEDGTLDSEVILTRGTEFVDDESTEIKEVNQINGKDVTQQEAKEEWTRITANLHP